MLASSFEGNLAVLCRSVRRVAISLAVAKIASMKARMAELREIEAAVEAHPDKQISQTDPDARSMAKAGGGTTVGYNVQTAVDSENHLIVAHEVTLTVPRRLYVVAHRRSPAGTRTSHARASSDG